MKLHSAKSTFHIKSHTKHDTLNLKLFAAADLNFTPASTSHAGPLYKTHSNISSDSIFVRDIAPLQK